MPIENTEFLIQDIFHCLEDMEHAENVSQLHKLEKEALILHHEIEIATKRFSVTLSLLKETTNLLRYLVPAIHAFDTKSEKVEANWVSYWGVIMECDNAVYEMESITYS